MKNFSLTIINSEYSLILPKFKFRQTFSIVSQNFFQKISQNLQFFAQIVFENLYKIYQNVSKICTKLY